MRLNLTCGWAGVAAGICGGGSVVALLFAAASSDPSRSRGLLVPVSAATARPVSARSTHTLCGFTPVPHDASIEAVVRTRATIVHHPSLFALHFDDDIPWKEAQAAALVPFVLAGIDNAAAQ